MTVLYLYLVVWGVTDWAFSVWASNCTYSGDLCHFSPILAQLPPPASKRPVHAIALQTFLNSLQLKKLWLKHFAQFVASLWEEFKGFPLFLHLFTLGFFSIASPVILPLLSRRLPSANRNDPWQDSANLVLPTQTLRVDSASRYQSDGSRWIQLSYSESDSAKLGCY